jgi:ribosome recycling factor
LRTLEKEKRLSQDDLHRTTDALQKVTDSFIAQVNEIGEEKEAELMEV